MAEVPEANEKNDIVPVEDAKRDERADEQDELGHAPERFAFVLPHQRVENRLGIFTEETEERVAERMLRLAVVAMFVNRDPIDRLTLVVRPIRVPLVMLHVDAVVENLAEPDTDGFENAEETVQDRPPEIRVVNEV